MIKKLALAFALLPSLALAQSQVTNHNVPIGRGPGVQGFGSLGGAGCNGKVLQFNGANADPTCVSQTVTPSVPTVLTYGASGSAVTTTGTISAGSHNLTIASAGDFANNQGIFVAHAGAAFTASPPSNLTVVPNVTAAVTFAYRIAAVDNACGVGAAIAAVTITNGQSLTKDALPQQYNTVSWTGGAGAWGYAVWRSTSGGAYQLIAVTDGVSIQDTGFPQKPSICVPTTPNSSALADMLVTTISSGGGTTSLVLAATAATAATAQLVQHDDTAGIVAAMAANTSVQFPPGTYNHTGLTIPSNVIQLYCSGGPYNTLLQSPVFVTTGASFSGATVLSIAGTGPLDITGCAFESTIPNDIATTSGIEISGVTNLKLTNIRAGGSVAYYLHGNTTVQVTDPIVDNFYNVGIKTADNNIKIVSPTVRPPSAYPPGFGSAIAFQSGIFGEGSVTGGNIEGASQFGVVCTNYPYLKVTGMFINSDHEGLHPQDGCSHFEFIGNHVTAPYDFGISVADDGNSAAIGPGLISDNLVYNTHVAGIGIVATGQTVANITVRGNLIFNPNRSIPNNDSACGVLISGATAAGNTVDNNTVVDVSGYTFWNYCEFSTAGVNYFGLAPGQNGSHGKVNIINAGTTYMTQPVLVSGPAHY